VTDRDKHSNLLRYKIIYDCRAFYSTGSWFRWVVELLNESNESNFETTNLFEQSFLIDQIDFSYLNTH